MEYSTTEFETLYIQCFPPSMRLAMCLLHEEDEARDVVQEVFLKLWAFSNPEIKGQCHKSKYRCTNHLGFVAGTEAAKSTSTTLHHFFT